MSGRQVPVAVLGGGAYAARLAEVIAATPELPAVELRLVARDAGRLAVIAAHAALRAAPVHAVRPCRLDDALDGAAAVVLLIRVGGLAARARDERIPGRFGLVGDEGVGAGGAANAWRTLPALAPIAARMAERAPAARVLNLMAPLGVTTRFLVEAGLDAVGLCELPVVTEERWRAHAATNASGEPSGDDRPLAYAGLNHLGFFWSPAGPPLDHPALRAAIDRGDVPAEIAERFGAAPLHYFVDVFEPEAAARAGRGRRPGRAEELAALQGTLVAAFRAAPGAEVPALAARPTPWFDRALVPALRAALGGPAYRGAVNLPSAGALDEASGPVAVELMGAIDGDGARFDPAPARPPAVRDILARLARAEDLVYRAALRRDRSLLAEALWSAPLPWPGPDAGRGDRVHRLVDSLCEEEP